MIEAGSGFSSVKGRATRGAALPPAGFVLPPAGFGFLNRMRLLLLSPSRLRRLRRDLGSLARTQLRRPGWTALQAAAAAQGHGVWVLPQFGWLISLLGNLAGGFHNDLTRPLVCIRGALEF